MQFVLAGHLQARDGIELRLKEGETMRNLRRGRIKTRRKANNMLKKTTKKSQNKRRFSD